MKNILRFAVVICLVLGTLLAALPASAGSTKTEVTGLTEGIDMPINPDFREWMSGHIWHWRNETIALRIYASDPRLNGYDLASNNGDIHYTNNWEYLFMHIYNQGIIYANEDFTIPLWSCSGNGGFDAQFNFSMKTECHGMGEYAGLVAHLSYTMPGDVMIFEGEILGPKE